MQYIETQEISEHLTADGWALTYHVVDPGGLNKPSKFAVTLTRNGASFTTEYTKGAGLRTWKKGIPGWQYMPSLGLYTAYWERYRKKGQRVGMVPHNLNDKDKFTHQVISEFNGLTKAEPPTLDEVVWSLLMDTSSVRHGQTFEDFCGECGYDTDSRKAEKMFNGCRDEWAALVRLGVDFATMDQLFQNY